MVIGDKRAGKSCLIRRYCAGQFMSSYIPTVGTDYGVKEVEQPDDAGDGDDDERRRRPARVDFWDMAGAPEYYEVRKEMYRTAAAGGIALVYDASMGRGPDACLVGWTEELRRCGVDTGQIPVTVCANKSDGCRNRGGNRGVAGGGRGRAFAEKEGFAFFETSACTGENVREMFGHLVDRALNDGPK